MVYQVRFATGSPSANRLRVAPSSGEMLMITSTLATVVFRIANTKSTCMQTFTTITSNSGRPIATRRRKPWGRSRNSVIPTMPMVHKRPRQNSKVQMSAPINRNSRASGLRIRIPVVVRSTPLRWPLCSMASGIVAVVWGMTGTEV